MTLRTAEGLRETTYGRIKYNLEQKLYAPFAIPSTKNLVKVFDILRKRNVKLDTNDKEGNRISISQRVFHHSYDSGPSWKTKGIAVAVRQKLPEEIVHGEKYLSIIMTRDQKEKIQLATCVVEPTITNEERQKYGDYKRIGDLRLDYIKSKGKFEKGIVDGNDDAFGLPTGEWFIDKEPFELSLTRAYLLLVNEILGVGEVPPIKSRQNIAGLIETGVI